MEKEKNLFVRYETKGLNKFILDYTLSAETSEFGPIMRGVFVPLVYNVGINAWSTVIVDLKYECGKYFTDFNDYFSEFEFSIQGDRSRGVILLGTARKN